MSDTYRKPVIITPYMFAHYIDHDDECPLCGSKDLGSMSETEEYDPIPETHYKKHPVCCYNCRATWTDIHGVNMAVIGIVELTIETTPSLECIKGN